LGKHFFGMGLGFSMLTPGMVEGRQAEVERHRGGIKRKSLVVLLLSRPGIIGQLGLVPAHEMVVGLRVRDSLRWSGGGTPFRGVNNRRDADRHGGQKAASPSA
jgi:hypothetical protein